MSFITRPIGTYNMFFLVLVASMCVHVVDANVFLGRQDDALYAPDPKLQRHLLEQMEAMLGSEHRTFTEKRLQRIENDLQPMFLAMPKTGKGTLDHAAVGYMLHRAFVHRHGWFVRSLAGEGKSMSMWDSSSVAGTFLGDKVSGDVIEALEKWMGIDGASLDDVAVLAATLEHLVHKEAIARLHTAYTAFGFASDDVVSPEEADTILNAYMAIYILGGYLQAMSNSTQLDPFKIRILLERIDMVYPTWKETVTFAAEMKQRVAPKRDYLYFADVANIVEEIGEHYGEFQNQECLMMRDQLKSAEQAGSPGRIRLADFYSLSKTTQEGMYSESSNYLRELGALDESDPANPRVLAANYINGPSNCIASSDYYSVCCRDECEDLLSQLETKLGRPDATRAQVISMVSAMSSRSEPANRQLSPWLLARLDEVTKHHGDRIPLHGRLFSQWMHYAYPRECAYPHVAHAVAPPKLETILAQPDLKASIDSIVASPEEMALCIQDASNTTFTEEDSDASMWLLEEELLVARPNQTGFLAFARTVAFAAALFSVSMALSYKLTSKSYSSRPEKYMV